MWRACAPLAAAVLQDPNDNAEAHAALIGAGIPSSASVLLGATDLRNESVWRWLLNVATDDAEAADAHVEEAAPFWRGGPV